MVSDISVKQETIVEAAIRRFSHFGINKTTLSEIAGDLNISKTLLFYYFDDKQSLIIAVLEKLSEDFIQTLQERLSGVTATKEGLYIFIEVKQESFKKNMQLAMQEDTVQINRSSPKLLKMMAKVRKTVLNIVADILEKGIERKELRVVNVQKTSELILEVLQSLEIRLKHNSLIPSDDEIDQLATKQKEFIDLLFSGLKNDSLIKN